MYDVGFMMKNLTRDYSPITMNSDWPWLWRLFFMTLFTVTGTFTNTIFVSTFFISKELKKKGNIFLACLGLTDLIITTMVVPSAIVALFSQQNESTGLCRTLQFLTQWSTYSYSLFFMLVSWEFHTRLVSGWCRYRVFIKYPFSFMSVLNFIVSFVISSVGAYYDLDYDYCNREHFGNYWFRLNTSIAFYVIPCLITIFFLSDTAYVLHNRVMSVIRLKRYMQFQRDKDLSHLHLLCYALFIVAWIPYLVLVNKYPDAIDATYYALIWVGLVRSTMTSFLYCTLNPNFREAFKSLFTYCCCKTPIPQPSNGRLVNGFYRDANGVREEPPVQYLM